MESLCHREKRPHSLFVPLSLGMSAVPPQMLPQTLLLWPHFFQDTLFLLLMASLLSNLSCSFLYMKVNGSLACTQAKDYLAKTDDKCGFTERQSISKLGLDWTCRINFIEFEANGHGKCSWNMLTLWVPSFRCSVLCPTVQNSSCWISNCIGCS